MTITEQQSFQSTMNFMKTCNNNTIEVIRNGLRLLEDQEHKMGRLGHFAG